jgi:hypothetical protein
MPHLNYDLVTGFVVGIPRETFETQLQGYLENLFGDNIYLRQDTIEIGCFDLMLDCPLETICEQIVAHTGPDGWGKLQVFFEGDFYTYFLGYQKFIKRQWTEPEPPDWYTKKRKPIPPAITKETFELDPSLNNNGD